jgi:hydrogenase expression/formation protein HypC
MCLGVPGQIVSISSPEDKLGVVDIGGVKRVTNLVCVAPTDAPLESLVGQWVLVHVGFAMSRLDPAEAERTLALLREVGEIDEALAAMRDGEGATLRGPR